MFLWPVQAAHALFGKGVHARHIELDGYRNGWAINAPGDYELSLDYAPARWGRYALHLSQTTAYALVVSLLLATRATRRQRRRDATLVG